MNKRHKKDLDELKYDLERATDIEKAYGLISNYMYSHITDKEPVGSGPKQVAKELKELKELNKKRISALHDVLDIQCSDGNWDYDPYMLGMANGMILIDSIMTDNNPEFLSTPKDGYIADKPDTDEKCSIAVEAEPYEKCREVEAEPYDEDEVEDEDDEMDLNDSLNEFWKIQSIKEDVKNDRCEGRGAKDDPIKSPGIPARENLCADGVKLCICRLDAAPDFTCDIHGPHAEDALSKKKIELAHDLRDIDFDDKFIYDKIFDVPKARRILREAFEFDHDFKNSYMANIKMFLYDRTGDLISDQNIYDLLDYILKE